MISDGVEITIRYRNSPVILTIQKAFTLKEFELFDSEELVTMAARHMINEINMEIKLCQRSQ